MNTEDQKDIKENNLRFKTNIQCGGCIAQVTPYLNQAVGEGHWSVDTSSPQKVLTIRESAEGSKIIETLKQAGYAAELIQQVDHRGFRKSFLIRNEKSWKANSSAVLSSG